MVRNERPERQLEQRENLCFSLFPSGLSLDSALSVGRALSSALSRGSENSSSVWDEVRAWTKERKGERAPSGVRCD